MSRTGRRFKKDSVRVSNTSDIAGPIREGSGSVLTDELVCQPSVSMAMPQTDDSALGHVRLDINDLSPSGCQPLHSTDKRVHTVVNGEIYDYDKLRREMEQKIDYRFQGTSDSELVLALYKYYGLSFLSHIRGEFSICLFDSERELFIAVRDRYGIKPLFWTVQNGELLVAAEMKAFLPLGWRPEWDVRSIVGGDFQIGNSTIFKGVQKVSAKLDCVCMNHV